MGLRKLHGERERRERKRKEKEKEKGRIFFVFPLLSPLREATPSVLRLLDSKVGVNNVKSNQIKSTLFK
jgi:hypothetical protein